MNYACLIVKIVKEPEQQFFGHDLKLTMTEFTGKYVLGRNRKHVDLIKVKIWGDLAYQVKEFYKLNDYLIVEGFISLQNQKFIDMSVQRIYPFLLSSQTSDKDKVQGLLF
uniref:Single-stranded DNA-binding protein n=1 Tax=Leptocylindrus danicus TaxID=163516 RepID=A0A023HBX4_9STRA|nr:hypothetical protein [Leptocylindrus danicus]AGH28888.1 hypothetical protein [Leptocylindrus danicus]